MPKKSRKQIIYEVAADCFQEKGYTASSMREIAERVGIEASSLYSHIKSKEEIIIRICTDCADLFHRGIDNIILKESDPIDKIRDIIHMHIDMARNNPSTITVFTDEWRHLPEKEKKIFVASRKAYESKVTGIIRQAIGQNLIEKIRPETMVNSIISSVRWTYYKHNLTNEEEVNLLKDEMTSLILHGICA